MTALTHGARRLLASTGRGGVLYRQAMHRLGARAAGADVPRDPYMDEWLSSLGDVDGPRLGASLVRHAGEGAAASNASLDFDALIAAPVPSCLAEGMPPGVPPAPRARKHARRGPSQAL